VTRRTVRGARRTVRTTDGPEKLLEQPVLQFEKRTVCTLPADSPTRANSPATPGEQSGNHFQPKPPDSTDQNKATQELTTNTTNSQLTDSSRTVCRPGTDGAPGTDRAARARKREVNPSYISMDIPNDLSS
jgi:hypothetical protein